MYLETDGAIGNMIFPALYYTLDKAVNQVTNPKCIVIVADPIQKAYPGFLKTAMVVLLLICFHFNMKAQPASVNNQTDTAAPKLQMALATPVKSRVWTVAAGHVALWTASYLALDKAWYSEFPGSNFHFFNDNGEWNQMDKAGHTWTAYQMSRISAGLWKWSGLNERKSAVLGGVSGLAYQSIIEIQDGFSSEWGFSWGDMAANFLGAATYVAQELGWHEQRFQFKLSYWPYDYDTDAKIRRNQLFGKSLPERLLKDYNSQTYWLSANIASFIKDSKWPAWLNMAVGYNSSGMLGGFANTWTDKQGNTLSRPDIERVRHFVLSPDIDLTKIHTNKKWVRTLLYVANMVKIPAPAISLSSKGKFKAYALYW